jgi:bacterioferritin-associated ferredoxin
MYLCICNAITDSEVRDLVAQGCRSVASVYRGLNCEPQCCKCTADIRRVINGTADDAALSSTALASA